MKRLFFQSKIYDYKTKKEAESHMVQMEEKRLARKGNRR